MPAWVVVTGLLVGVDGFLVVVEAAGMLDVVAAGLCEVEVVGFFEVVDAALLDEVVAGFLDVVVAFEVETEVVTGLIEVVVARAVVIVRAVVMPPSPAPQPHEQPQLSTPQWIGKENPKSCDLCLVIQVEGGAVQEEKAESALRRRAGARASRGEDALHHVAFEQVLRHWLGIIQVEPHDQPTGGAQPICEPK